MGISARGFVLCLATAASLGRAVAGGIDTGEAARDFRAETGAPAAGVALWTGGEVGIGVAGLRARGTAAEVAPGDAWHLGSITKSMTATLAARLVERGAVGWDSTVGEVLGATVPGMDAAYREVTLTDLLAHRGGLAPNLGLLRTLTMMGTDARRDAAADRAAYARAVLARAPAVEPGTGFLYSNAGYVVAGLMLETATGRDWEGLMRAVLFAPLGLRGAGFGPPGAAGDAPEQPRGHRPGPFGGLRAVPPGPTADNVPAMGPAGRVHMPLGDLMRYLRAHAERDPALLSAASWERLHRRVEGQDYALGWAVDESGRLSHSGSNTMWFARVVVDPRGPAALALVTNSGAIEAMRPAFEAAEARWLPD